MKAYYFWSAHCDHSRKFENSVKTKRIDIDKISVDSDKLAINYDYDKITKYKIERVPTVVIVDENDDILEFYDDKLAFDWIDRQPQRYNIEDVCCLQE